ncbi:hypothetical protein MiYa_04030 [Microcystis aeruginosa NIES-2519]|uniref:Uncharacterized protein n=1 Tax=Microcystis aeruginosa NIES-2519 TaxID=2303981 RepID=A0A5A5RH50_MICAE|nr:hypothetical protein MiYa_04030 [Microcystis aeruginosa NIES-2519]GCA83135.1 hypothetical protein MiHa_01093 [Microcystis aeruginosa NIES-2522]GCA89004.1 hypothetical protein MiTa_02353 [Microcystis aeruginosa NIES-4264]CCI31966.1 Similar to tr/P72713/P72713 (modular protein) [Microcystis sp. T1-4]
MCPLCLCGSFHPLALEKCILEYILPTKAGRADILAKLDNRLERIETKLEVLPKIEAEVSQLKEDVKDLKERATAQISALIVTVIGATVAATIKFGFLTKT